MADDAINALLPVAAVVHIALGIMSLILVRKTKDRAWNEKFAGYIISWMMIILGLEYTFATIIDFKIEQFTPQDFADGSYTELLFSSYKFGERAMDSAFISLVFILPFIYPYPILQKESAVKVSAGIVILLGLLIIPIDIFTEYTHRDIKLSVTWFCYFIWMAVYLRFLFGELLYGEEKAREVSAVSVLLLLGVKIQFMIFWLINLSGKSQIYQARWIVEDDLIGGVSQSEISTSIFLPVAMTLSGLTLVFLMGGELWRAFKKGVSGLTVIISVIFVVGIIWFLLTIVMEDTTKSCVETVCGQFPKSFIDWYAFTFQVAVYLLVPLIFMYVILNYNIVDTSSSESKVITRIMVLLLLLVATSSLIEMIQIVLPIPEMVTSAIFAGGVVLFIGWEEKIMDRMMKHKSNVVDSIDKIIPLNKPMIDEGDYRTFSIVMFSLVIYGLLLALLFDSLGLHR